MNNSKNLRPMPSPWLHKPTQTVRVPTVFADAALDYVRKLDSGCTPIDTEQLNRQPAAPARGADTTNPIDTARGGLEGGLGQAIRSANAEESGLISRISIDTTATASSERSPSVDPGLDISRSPAPVSIGTDGEGSAIDTVSPTPDDIFQEFVQANDVAQAHELERQEIEQHLRVLLNIIERLGPIAYDIPAIHADPIEIGAFGKALEGLKIRMNCLEQKLTRANMQYITCLHRSRMLVTPKQLPPEPVDLDALVARRWQGVINSELLQAALGLLKELAGDSYHKRAEIKAKALKAYELLAGKD